ncbi:energy transducer TonB [Selenomonadales bacterium OttesenSCG-928-I06]|nr:energy transducer TonB [Selenomonadales bacterium OttesenSCG-928-I06]
MERWHKAILISVIFHLFIFVFLGTVIRNEAFYQENLNQIQVYLLDDQKPSLAAGATNAANLRLDNDIRKVSADENNKPVSVNNIKSNGFISNAAGNIVGNLANSTSIEGSSSNNDRVSGAGINNGDGGSDIVTKPEVLKKIKPKYPQFARDKGLEASVILKVRISKKGIPDEVTITESSGYSQFDEEAVKAIYKWRFSPARNASGEAVVYYYNIPVDFILKG